MIAGEKKNAGIACFLRRKFIVWRLRWPSIAVTATTLVNLIRRGVTAGHPSLRPTVICVRRPSSLRNNRRRRRRRRQMRLRATLTFTASPPSRPPSPPPPHPHRPVTRRIQRSLRVDHPRACVSVCMRVCVCLLCADENNNKKFAYIFINVRNIVESISHFAFRDRPVLCLRARDAIPRTGPINVCAIFFVFSSRPYWPRPILPRFGGRPRVRASFFDR